MPPSGFNENHTHPLTTFLHRCLDELVDENRGKRTPHEALAREISNIDSDLARIKRSDFATATLKQVMAFYAALANRLPAGETSFDALILCGYEVENVLAEEILAVRVVEESEA